MPVEGDGIHPGKKTRRKSEKEMGTFANSIKTKGGTNKAPFHASQNRERQRSFPFVLFPLLAAGRAVLGAGLQGDGGRRHCAATVREDDGGTAGGGAAEVVAAAAGEGGDAGWPWELARWRRHLNDPACVAGAQTHLGAAPWPWVWPWAEDADDQLLRMCFGDAAAAPVGVVLWWWPWNLPSSAAVST